MNKSILTAILTVLMLTPTFSAETIDKGDSAPYKGVIFTVKEEKALQKMKLKNLGLVEINSLHKQKSVIQSQRIDLLRKQLKSNQSVWQKIGYFTIGVLATSAALYGGSQLAKTIGN